ncbi:MAG: prephenate dehydrogenase/arogenate dehydrogenase family protein [Thermodesulfobacteriota bacterium]|nr:prephenate dehydrogenase/arogenate dehydrogenase family protein [Thermodesulfobacteriota bacterium]
MKIREIAIIGARGQMGSLFAQRSREAGLQVRELGRPLILDQVAKALSGADMVLLSVPVNAMRDMAEMAGRLMHKPQILCDVCSVKTEPVHTMLNAYPGPVVGTHPLFGPDPGKDARVAVCPGRNKNAQKAVSDWIDLLGFKWFTTTPKKHDRAMAFIQGLNFATTVSYLATLGHRPELVNFLTPSFERRLKSAKKMLTRDAELFSNLFEANPYSQESVRMFRSVLNVAAGGDIELLAERAAWWWRDEEDEDE